MSLPTLRVLTAAILLLSQATTGVIATNSKARDRLVEHLFLNYDSSSRPNASGEKLSLLLEIKLQHFDFQESDGSFRFEGFLIVAWHDYRLAWSPIEFNDITRIPVLPKVMWVPDLEIYNNAPDKFIRMHRNGNVILDYTGNIQWADKITVVIFCTTNMHYWPHDRHECKLSLGSWTYHGYDVDISSNPNISMNFRETSIMENMEYKVIDFRAEHVATVYQCCAEPYITIDYYISFERRSSYVVIFRALALTIVLLTLLALTMQPWRTEKLWLYGVSALINIFNLIYFVSKMGHFTRVTPLIVTFYSCSFVLVTLAELVSICSLFATRTRFRGKLPIICTKIVKSSLLAQLVAPIHTKAVKDNQNDLHSQFEDVKLQEDHNLIDSETFSSDWIRLARILERVALILFGLLFIILATICFV